MGMIEIFWKNKEMKSYIYPFSLTGDLRKPMQTYYKP